MKKDGWSGPCKHHLNLLSWRQSLADVVEIGLDDNGILDIETLRSQLDLYKINCKTSSPICFACFDFAASDAYVKINLRSSKIDGYDAIFLSTDKFLGGPGTPGILLMCKALNQLGSSPPSNCGGGTVNYVNAFNEKDYIGMKPGWKRITFPYNMSNEEFDFMLAPLEFIAGYGQRFRPLYHFNVKEGIWCSRQEAINDSIDKKNNNSIINPLANALKDLRLSNEHKNPDTERLKKIN
ncbi:hypothetical protein WN944_023278 [Citrus x changshan-huyou]|uniref:Uncharacterized protein n=1 Tax=Citrus x changshan-huyou TaxID=2935761 RepID=A0AAP0R3Q5_9ROSI